MTVTVTMQRDPDRGCIPACAAAALAHAGHWSPTEAELITQMYFSGVIGKSGFDLLNGALTNLGLPSFTVERGVNLAERLVELVAVGVPVLVPIRIPPGGPHCVVVAAVSGGVATVHDPGNGQVFTTQMSDIVRFWCGDIAYLEA